jgi:hypothetical protein
VRKSEIISSKVLERFQVFFLALAVVAALLLGWNAYALGQRDGFESFVTERLAELAVQYELLDNQASENSRLITSPKSGSDNELQIKALRAENASLRRRVIGLEKSFQTNPEDIVTIALMRRDIRQLEVELEQAIEDQNEQIRLSYQIFTFAIISLVIALLANSIIATRK